jgi:hypothetical protein
VLVIALVLNGEVQEGSNLELKAVRAIEKHQELRSGHLTDIGADSVREALLAFRANPQVQFLLTAGGFSLVRRGLAGDFQGLKVRARGELNDFYHATRRHNSCWSSARL